MYVSEHCSLIRRWFFYISTQKLVDCKLSRSFARANVSLPKTFALIPFYNGFIFTVGHAAKWAFGNAERIRFSLLQIWLGIVSKWVPHHNRPLLQTNISDSRMPSTSNPSSFNFASRWRYCAHLYIVGLSQMIEFCDLFWYIPPQCLLIFLDKKEKQNQLRILYILVPSVS